MPSIDASLVQLKNLELLHEFMHDNQGILIKFPRDMDQYPPSWKYPSNVKLELEIKDNDTVSRLSMSDPDIGPSYMLLLKKQGEKKLVQHNFISYQNDIYPVDALIENQEQKTLIWSFTNPWPLASPQRLEQAIKLHYGVRELLSWDDIETLRNNKVIEEKRKLYLTEYNDTTYPMPSLSALSLQTISRYQNSFFKNTSLSGHLKELSDTYKQAVEVKEQLAEAFCRAEQLKDFQQQPWLEFEEYINLDNNNYWHYKISGNIPDEADKDKVNCVDFGVLKISKRKDNICKLFSTPDTLKRLSDILSDNYNFYSEQESLIKIGEFLKENKANIIIKKISTNAPFAKEDNELNVVPRYTIS